MEHNPQVGPLLLHKISIPGCPSPPTPYSFFYHLPRQIRIPALLSVEHNFFQASKGTSAASLPYFPGLTFRTLIQCPKNVSPNQ